jgi:putative nucleotidyltransferase with HDIG domain
MSIPSRAAAASLLLSVSPPTGILRHSQAVADVASWLASRVRHAGHPVDVLLVETAALLHDVDKALPRDHPLRALGHGHAGARWLEQQGYPELAPAVDTHPVGRLAEQPYAAWIAATTLEQRLVAYADKRAQQRVVTLDARFARWRRKHPEMEQELAISRERAGELETEVCRLAGITPDQVQRARWARDVVRRAATGPAA